jgi:Fanconi-associated nuclease 1
MEIENGDYLSIIKTAYNRESPKNTMCVGINWKYELDDLLEIAEVKLESLFFLYIF